MREYGIPDKFIRLIKAVYDGFWCVVFHEGKYSSFFAVESGFKQGRVLSDLLFIIIIDWRIKQTTEGRDTRESSGLAEKSWRV